MTGVIGVSLMPVSKPRSCRPDLKNRGVVPQPLDALRLVLQDVDRRDARRGHGRRLGRREEQRPAALDQVILEVLVARDVAAHHADGLATACRPGCRRGRGGRNGRSCRGRSCPARRLACASSTMTRRLVAIRDVADAGQRRDVAVHREDAVRDDQDRAVRAVRAAAGARVAQDLLEAVDVAMRKYRARRLGHADAVDDRGVVELVADDQVALARDRRDRAAVGGEARLEASARLDVLERRRAVARAPRAGSCRRRSCAPRPCRRRTRCTAASAASTRCG